MFSELFILSSRVVSDTYRIKRLPWQQRVNRYINGYTKFESAKNVLYVSGMNYITRYAFMQQQG